jgi:hypothetical protein
VFTKPNVYYESQPVSPTQPVSRTRSRYPEPAAFQSRDQRERYIIANSLVTVRQFRAVLMVFSLESNQALVSLLFPAPLGRCK